MRKNIELYEMICVRHGLMVVGPTGGGKSSCIRTLKESLTFLKKVTRRHGPMSIQPESEANALTLSPNHLNP